MVRLNPPLGHPFCRNPTRARRGCGSTTLLSAGPGVCTIGAMPVDAHTEPGERWGPRPGRGLVGPVGRGRRAGRHRRRPDHAARRRPARPPRGAPAGPGLPAARRRARPGRPRLRRDHGGLRRRRAAAVGVRHPERAPPGREHRLRRGQQLGRAPRRHQRARHGAGASTSPVNVIGAEHFRAVGAALELRGHPDPRPARPAPLLGVLDITGGDEIVVPQTDGDGPRRRPDGRVRAGPRAAHRAVAATPRRAARRAGSRLLMESLGRNDALLTVDDGRGRRRTLRLSPRHSEILLLLASAPRGLSGDELAVLLYEEDMTASTLRAELNRLRSLLGRGPARVAALPARRPRSPPTGSASRRTSRPATSRVAMRAYRGPLLPRSTAPGRRPPARERRGPPASSGPRQRRAPTSCRPGPARRRAPTTTRCGRRRLACLGPSLTAARRWSPDQIAPPRPRARRSDVAPRGLSTVSPAREARLSPPNVERPPTRGVCLRPYRLRRATWSQRCAA